MRRTLLAFVASIVLLAAFVIVVGPASLSAQLARTNLPVFALGFLSMAGALLFWGEGLRPLLADAGAPITRSRAVVAYTAAMFGRQVLPLGAVGGPAVTAYTVEREVDLSYDETLAIVAVAEFLSIVASLSMAGIGVLFLLGDLAAVSQLRVLVYATAAFAVVLLLLGVAFLRYRNAVRRSVHVGAHLLCVTVGRVSPRIAVGLAPPRTTAALDRFYATVDEVGGNRRTVAAVLGLHFVGWVLSAIPLYTSAIALDVPVSLALVFLLVPTSDLVAVLPLPGGLGGVEIVLATIVAAAAGVSLPVAAAVVMLYRIATYWFIVLVGLVAMVYAAVDVVGIEADA